MKYLKDETYYNDLYERTTVSVCRFYVMKPKKGEKWSQGQQMAANYINNIYLKSKMSDRALKKEETIKKWIDKDKKKDEYIESLIPPKTRCLECCEVMEFDIKEYIGEENGKQDRVLFIFVCPTCKKRRAIYNDGEEYVIKKDLCKKCGVELICKSKKEADSIIITKKCPKCALRDKEIIDLKFKKEEDPDFEKDKAIFCISYTEALKYKEDMDNIKRYVDNFKEVMEKYDKKDALKEDLAKIKKLKFKEIEKLLNEELAQIGYTGFIFSTPALGNDIKAEYTVFVETSEENEGMILKGFKNKLKELLSDTNWAEVTDGNPEYKLGTIKGKLRGLDSEEDLIKLIEKRRNNDCKTK